MDSYFVDLTMMDDEYYPVCFGPEEGSPHNQLVALFLDEQEAWDYCNFKNRLEEVISDDEGYEDLEFE